MVTGATGGIGTAMVTELSRRGYRTVAVGRDELALASVAGDGGTFVVWDQRDAAVPRELHELDRVDALVHVAGVAPRTGVADTTETALAAVLSVNLVSATTLTAALLPALRHSRGHVVFVNSSAGLSGVAGWSGYLGSKWALKELADSLRSEESAHGVRVTSVFPGAVATDLLKQVRHDQGRPYEPQHAVSPQTAARLIADVLDHPEDAYLTELSFTR